MLDPLTIGLGVTALVGVSGAAIAGWGWRESRLEGDQLELDLDAVRAEVASASAARMRAQLAEDAARAGLARAEAALRETASRLHGAELRAKEVEEARTRDLAALRQSLEEARRAGEAARRQVEDLKRDLARATEEKHDVEESRAQLVVELRRLRSAATSTEAELAQHRTALRHLGVRLDEGAYDPRAPSRRVASRAALSDLVASTSIQAAALVDDRGLPHLAVGAEPAIERIAYAGGVLDELLPILEAALEQPLNLFTLADARAAVYLLRPEDRLVLGAASSGGPPGPALRAASLRLRGRPGPAPVFAEVPGLVGEAEVALDPRLDEIVGGWGRRRGAESVTVLDPAGTVRAAWGPARPAAALLRAALGPLLTRAVRDRLPLASVEIEARAERGTLAVRFVRDTADTPCVVVRTHAPLAPSELDELCASLRWHRPSPARLAAQGAP